MNPLRIDLIHAPDGTLITPVAAQRVLDLRRVPVVDVNGVVKVGGEAVPLTIPGSAAVKTFTSQVITQAAMTSGATKNILLTSPPTAMTPNGCYVITTGGPVASNNGATTGLTVEVGLAGDPDSLMKSISVFGAAGRKGGAVGVDLGSLRNADALQIKFTAVGGGSENVTHITGLSLRVIITYVAAPV